MLTLRHLRKNQLPKSALLSNNGVLERLIYFTAIVSPLMTFPQLYGVWISKNTSGVSIPSWLGFCFFNAIWVIYGVAHKDKPIVLCNASWVLLQGLVVLGVILNR